ncbi:hypothetical protein MXD62_22015 [Frankia sp. Mgl5]|uniref:hypothetical protein n=1 Tax=Frankia sp. Mgl5 TaxID=2933793 RepID=UPI00200D234F|nr:hypothetical protein [Frankia sp. Mgl5]MCK9929813.1 hypothetical protein [Frankia sp. Mgl5]
MAISNDLRRAYVTNYATPFVSVIDTATKPVVATIRVDATSMDIAILDARTYHVRQRLLSFRSAPTRWSAASVPSSVPYDWRLRRRAGSG